MADNTITLVGNITRDPELRFTANGRAVASFGIAVGRRYQVNGEWQGCVWPFAKGFYSGVNRLSFGPDGKLYMTKGNSKGLAMKAAVKGNPDRIAPKPFRELAGFPGPAGAPSHGCGPAVHRGLRRSATPSL